jgi:hypothetical protein
MNDGQYDDLVGHRAEVDRVREAPYQRAAYLTVHARVPQGCLKNVAKRRLNLGDKGATQPRTLALVPVTSVE